MGRMNEISQIQDELGVGEQCARDVWYLRTRSRWSEDLEEELIRLHAEGHPPVSVGDFGVTGQTQQDLFATVMEELDTRVCICGHTRSDHHSRATFCLAETTGHGCGCENFTPVEEV